MNPDPIYLGTMSKSYLYGMEMDLLNLPANEV